jgi:hypothetical protein
MRIGVKIGHQIEEIHMGHIPAEQMAYHIANARRLRTQAYASLFAAVALRIDAIQKAIAARQQTPSRTHSTAS